MHLELNDEEAGTLREILQQRVVELDKEINATESMRTKTALREHARTVERILGAVTTADAPGPADWEPRDAVNDAER